MALEKEKKLSMTLKKERFKDGSVLESRIENVNRTT